MQKVILSNSGDFLKYHYSDDFLPLFAKFPDGEISIDFSGLDFSAPSFLIIQSFFKSSDAIVELLLAIDTISRNSSKPINILLSYLSYSRQDREISNTMPISAKVIADLLSHQNVATISIVDLHSSQIQGFFSKPCFNILLQDFFFEHIKKNFDLSQSIIVSADIGGAKNARQIANKLGINSAIVEKVRPKAGHSIAMSIIGNVTDKNCILIDDIIDTAGTLCNAADILMEGGAKSVVAYASHGLFSNPAFERVEQSHITKIFISNTLPLQCSSSKIVQLNVIDFVLNQISEKIANFS